MRLRTSEPKSVGTGHAPTAACKRRAKRPNFPVCGWLLVENHDTFALPLAEATLTPASVAHLGDLFGARQDSERSLHPWNLELPPASQSESGDMGPEKKKTFH